MVFGAGIAVFGQVQSSAPLTISGADKSPSSSSASITSQSAAPAQPIGSKAEGSSIASPVAEIDMTASERQYFDFGYSLSKAAFAHAVLTKKAISLANIHDRDKKLQELAALAPKAMEVRGNVLRYLNDAYAAMHNLKAPSYATAVIEAQIATYSKPIKYAPSMKDLCKYNPNAAVTLGCMDSFERTSGVPEYPELHKWMTSSKTSGPQRVWYAEGLIAGVAEIAADQDMPELLPPLSDITTDIRGLRDWLTLRLPETPSPEQMELRKQLNDFLIHVKRPESERRLLTRTELGNLGLICKNLKELVLPTKRTAKAAQ